MHFNRENELKINNLHATIITGREQAENIYCSKVTYLNENEFQESNVVLGA